MRVTRILGLATLAAFAAAACADESSSELRRNRPGDSATDGDPSTATDAPPLGEESSLPLPRLTRGEYIDTLGDLLHAVVGTDASAILERVVPLATTMPTEQLVAPPAEGRGGFRRLDQSQQQEYADVPFQVAVQVAEDLTRTPERLAKLVGACATGGIDRACFEGFVRRFGELALRAPLDDEDVAFYVGDAPATNIPREEVASVVTRLLSAPRFLYHVESGTTEAGADDIFALDAWELASRLSYHFWGTMPDAELREAARSGELLEPARYEAAVERLASDPRAMPVIESFFTQWFWPLIELPALDSRAEDPVFRAFAGPNMPSSELRGKMVQEVIDAATFVVQNGGSIRDLLTNRQSFAKDPELAALYGVAPWSGSGTPPDLGPERAGLLTRAAFLSTGSANTRPIMKGVFIRTTLLCDLIPPPPQDGMAVAVNLSPDLSTRQVVEEITEKEPRCAGCHQGLINPLGFATENFDALGRVRTTQTLFDELGNVVGQAPIDTRSTPRIGVEMGESSGIVETTKWLADSGRVEACFAQRYFRFTFRRVESTSGDHALIKVLTEAAREGGAIADMLKATALRPEFKRRRILQ